MKIYKQATFPEEAPEDTQGAYPGFSKVEQIENQQSYSLFSRAVSSKAVTWTHGGKQQFNNFSTKDGWQIVLTQRWGTINKERSPGRTPDFLVKIFLYLKEGENTRFRIELLSGRQQKIANWTGGNEKDDVLNNGAMEKIFSWMGIKDAHLMGDSQVKQMLTELGAEMLDNNTVYYHKRYTKPHSNYDNAQVLELWLAPIIPPDSAFAIKKPIGADTKFNVFFRNSDIERGVDGESRSATGTKGVALADARKMADDLATRALANGFVDETSQLYIPRNANRDNWNFSLNIPKPSSTGESQFDRKTTKFDFGDIDIGEMPPDKESAGNTYMEKTAQSDFGGYYSGNIPDPSSYVGTSAVEASQVKAAFSGADAAIKYVNQFDASLLKNIAFIFNFSKAGAYGVYLTELDRAIKTKVLQKKLEQMGYKVVENNGMPEAFPTKEEKSTEEIAHDIKSIYDGLNKGGGTAIGINMTNVLNAARGDLSNIQSTEPDALFQQLAILHLGETIVHEAIHAKGSMDEGPSEQAEAAFASWVLPKINQEYAKHLQSVGKEEEYGEIVIGSEKRHAAATNWYRLSQANAPFGSDLSGRHGGNGRSNEGVQDWGMMFNQMGNEGIEKKLGRQYMWPLAKDIDPDKDSIEEQLRKTFIQPPKDSSQGMEELLQKDRALESELYKPLETKLDDNRPHPLLQTLKKDASIFKTATVFGWYNNLSISDGSSIPGLGDRVMAWEDRDEDFAWSEKDIREQSRYNPDYDVKGFYYRWIEPRFAPQLFDDMTRDLTNTSPAKRFGGTNLPEKAQGMEDILRILSVAKDKINSGQIKACRFIVSGDLVEQLTQALQDMKISLYEMDDPVMSMWVCSNDVDDQNLEIAEKYFRGSPDGEDVAKQLLGMSNSDEVLDSVIGKLKNIGMSEGLDDIYLVGEPARERIFGEKISASVFRFCCEDKADAAAYGQHLSKVTGHDYDYDKSGDLRLNINDIAIIFHSGDTPDVCSKLVALGANAEEMENGVKCELSNKDFTINMMAYNLVDGSVYDPFGIREDIDNKVLRTRYDAHEVVNSNPTIILKALKMVNEGYEPDESLAATLENSASLLNKLSEPVRDIARMFMLKNRMIEFGE